jgi:hypothetical protein
MSKQTRYLLTVDSATGAAVKLERLGEAGDLTEVPLSSLSLGTGGAPGAAPMAGGGMMPAMVPVLMPAYLYMYAPLAPLQVITGHPPPVGPGTSPGTVGPGANLGIVVPGASLGAVGPGAPGGPGTATQLQGPGAPGVTTTTATTTQGPGAPGALVGTQGPGGTSGGGEGSSG